MTTIAWDGKTLATGSRGTVGNSIVDDLMVKLAVASETDNWTICGVKVKAFAGAGSGAIPEELKEYLIEGIKRNTKMREGFQFSVIAICEHGGFELYKREGEDGIEIQPLSSRRAMGSGENFALAAMLSGKDAFEAVQIAMKCDVYSGGSVDHYTP